MNDLIRDTMAEFQRPGAIKGLLGQLAIAVGARLVSSTAAEAVERRNAANDELEILSARIQAGHDGIVEMIHTGEFDVTVKARAIRLGYVRLPDDDADRDCGANDCDEPGHEHRSTTEACCDDPDPAHAAMHQIPGTFTVPAPKPQQAPEGLPGVPPRMAGGYLPAAGGFLSSLDIPTTGGDMPLREDGTVDAPDHPYNPIEVISESVDRLNSVLLDEANRASADAD